MKNSNWMKRFAAIAGSALAGLMLATTAYSAVEPITAEVTFADPITITSPVNLIFGVLDVALNLETITVGTDDTVTGSGTGLILGAPPTAASVLIGATASATLTILIDNISNGTGYALSAFVCNYNTGTDTACNSYTPTSVASATMLIGATLTGTNSAGLGPANGSFDVTVLYQ